MDVKQLSENAFLAIRKEFDQGWTAVFTLASRMEGEIPGVFSISTASDGLNLHCDDDKFAGAYRFLRSNGAGKSLRPKVMPYGPGSGGTVAITLPFEGIFLTLLFHTDDYSKFLKPGATCRRVPIIEKFVCD